MASVDEDSLQRSQERAFGSSSASSTSPSQLMSGVRNTQNPWSFAGNTSFGIWILLLTWFCPTKVYNFSLGDYIAECMKSPTQGNNCQYDSNQKYHIFLNAPE